MPIFDAAVDIQHRLIVPCCVASLSGKEIPVVFVPARPGHYIDAGSTTQDLAHIHWNGPSIEIGIGLGYKAPIALAPKVQTPLDCFHHPWHIVSTATSHQHY